MKEQRIQFAAKRVRQIAFLMSFLILLAPGVLAQKTRRKSVVVPASRPQVTQKEMKELSEAASQSRANLIASSKTYRESLVRLLDLQRQDVARAADKVEKNNKLLEMGLIAKRELEEGELLLTQAQSKFVETQKQIDSVDVLVAEVNAAEELAKMPAPPHGVIRSTGMLVRYVGASRWAMSDFTKVDAYFRLKFSKPLPISAYGQTDTHNRLGFDHHGAVDVAVHPDTNEGQELINYLRSQGISFIAIRGAIPGSATGAHIHIGQPSRRIVIQ